MKTLAFAFAVCNNKNAQLCVNYLFGKQEIMKEVSDQLEYYFIRQQDEYRMNFILNLCVKKEES